MPNIFLHLQNRNTFLSLQKPKRQVYQKAPGGTESEPPKAEVSKEASKPALIPLVLPNTQEARDLLVKQEAEKRALIEKEESKDVKTQKAQVGDRISLAKRLGLPPQPHVNAAPNIPGAPDIGAKNPEKPFSKMTGHEFIQNIKTLDKKEREKAIEQAITKENLPAFKDVKFEFTDAKGEKHTAQFSITKDALKVGVPNDPKNPQIRMPMTPKTAQALAKKFDAMLPTSDTLDHAMTDPGFAKIVMPLSGEVGIKTVNGSPEGKAMQDPENYEIHDRLITERAGDVGNKGLIGGKKVIVIGAKLNQDSEAYLKYKAEHPNLEPLNYDGGLKNDKNGKWQNDSIKHSDDYADNSHGTYLVKREWIIDGQKMDVRKVIELYPGLVGKAGLNPDIYAYYQDKNPAPARSVDNSEPIRIVTAPKSAPSPETGSAQAPRSVRAPRSAPEDSSEKVSVRALSGPPSKVEAREVSGEIIGYLPDRKAKTANESPKYNPDQSPERKESKNIEGSTLFLGDSIMTGTPIEANLKINGEREIIAQPNKTVDWLLKQLFDQDGKLKNPEMIGKMQNIVCLIGTNDIGGNRPVNELFADIQKIAKIKEKYPKLNIYICTIPPIKGYKNYDKDFKRINARRNQLNDLILSRAGNAYQVIQLHKLMADNPDDSANAKLGQSYDSVDHLHPQKNTLAALLQSEISKIQGNAGMEAPRKSPGGRMTPLGQERLARNADYMKQIPKGFVAGTNEDLTAIAKQIRQDKSIEEGQVVTRTINGEQVKFAKLWHDNHPNPDGTNDANLGVTVFREKPKGEPKADSNEAEV